MQQNLSKLDPDAVAALASRLRLAITRTSRRLRQEAGSGLSPSLSSALAAIDTHGPLTPSELADRERVKRPTATRVVSRLVGDGLVARTTDPTDARSALLATTPEGRSLASRMRKRKNAYLARRIRDLPPDDMAALERTVEVLEHLLDGEAQ
jgi:DNA-binding MarR family transcriptional regulator